MYSLIVAHETRSLVRSPALAWILGVLALAIAFGAFAAMRTVERNARGAETIARHEDDARAKMRADLERYETKVKAEGKTMAFAAVNHAPGEGPPQATNAGAVGSETQSFAVLPPTGLAALALGQTDMTLTYIPVSMKNVVEVTKQEEIENPVNLKTGPFDVAFVVIFLLPIFILAMSYDLLSSEKERGTLAMVLAHPISLRKLMASKLVSRAALMLAVVLLFGFGAVLSVGSALGEPATWARFAVWLGATVLYSLFWFGLAVLVNALGRNSATNGIVLAGAWLVFVVVVPTLVSLVATTAYPAPSRLDFMAASRDAQTAAEFERMKALDAYYYDHLDLVPDAEDKANDFLTLALANNAAVEKAVRPLYDRFETQREAQQRLVDRFQLLSPAIMMQRILAEASGTGDGRYAHFMRQVFTFHDTWKTFFTAKFLKREPLTLAAFDAIPRFAYVEETVVAFMARLLPSLLELFAVTTAIMAVAFAALRRYRVAGR
jgi:ABC-2 type transport system permease protein